MRILVISRTAWKQNNSFGNTYNNIFGKMKGVSIANIYLADGTPDSDNPNVVSYYQVSEKQMVKSLFGKRTINNVVGKEIDSDELGLNGNVTLETYDKAFSGMKKNRWSGFFIAREMVWKYGNINWDGILSFAKSFNPDIIFLPFYYAIYVDRVALYLKKQLNVPMVLEASIDIYSLKQLSYDPLYWINRFWIRRYVRKMASVSEKLYVISDIMKNDYEKYLHIECGVLYKFPDTSRKLKEYEIQCGKLQFLFTGNIGSGRWKTLALIGDTLMESGIGEMVIYTPTPMTAKMRKRLSNCVLKDPVSPEMVVSLQNEADVLVHVESFDLKDKLEVRYSISTKVMDYISAERCIFAVGPEDIASISFLNDNNLALVATNKESICSVIEKIKNDREACKKYAMNSHCYMTKMSEMEPQQEILYKDLKSIVDNYSGENRT